MIKLRLRRPGGALFEKTAPPGPPCKNFSLEVVSAIRCPLFVPLRVTSWLKFDDESRLRVRE